MAECILAAVSALPLERTGKPLEETESALIAQAAARFAGAAQLARSPGGERLFRYLLDSTLSGHVPREIEIAQDVFGRTPSGFDDSTSIRVHIHRLRRKLDEFYSGPGAAETLRLHLPKGHYQFRVERRDATLTAAPNPAREIGGGRTGKTARLGIWAALAVVLAICAGSIGWWMGRQPATAVERSLADVRATAVWHPVLSDQRRIAMVVGDYYIFGEREADGTVTRLVREFDVNSPRDLAQTISGQAPRSAGYVDLGLHYLPLGAANAVRAVAPVLASRDGGSVSSFAVPVSQLGPEMVKYTNLVYLGYLSGLGKLRGPMFSNSRFGIGNSFDEITDQETGRTYASSTPLDGLSGKQGEEYAIVAGFRGASGNRVLIIAGARDASLMQAAEFMTRPETLAMLDRYQGTTAGFEALLAIDSLDNVGLRARVVAASWPRRFARQRQTGLAWTNRPFPTVSTCRRSVLSHQAHDNSTASG